MSFSGEIKKELCRQTGGARHCQIAEQKAMLLYSRSGTDENGAHIFRTENLEIAQKYCLLLKKLFGLQVVRQEGISAEAAGQMTEATGQMPEAVGQIPEAGHSRQEPAAELLEDRSRRGRPSWCVTVRDAGAVARITDTVEHAIVRKDCCRRAFLRGAFLVAGSISDPNRSYHCEIVCGDEEAAQTLASVLADLHISARTARRKTHFIVYIKESSDLADIIGLMGARVALMEYENIRILKEMRENVNRKVNCETANINKTVSAAVRQIEDIRLIERTIGFRSLPKGLDEMATVRLQYPEATLQELGEKMSPQVGKSGVNHRLRKLGKVADAIRGDQGGEREW
ncbi:MAG: DNA-binding protein WhiA [Eubacterium sp.]|nr:DNA-binding protein WhiA [Eubacterium sp.]